MWTIIFALAGTKISCSSRPPASREGRRKPHGLVLMHSGTTHQNCQLLGAYLPSRIFVQPRLSRVLFDMTALSYPVYPCLRRSPRFLSNSLRGTGYEYRRSSHRNVEPGAPRLRSSRDGVVETKSTPRVQGSWRTSTCLVHVIDGVGVQSTRLETGVSTRDLVCLPAKLEPMRGNVVWALTRKRDHGNEIQSESNACGFRPGQTERENHESELSPSSRPPATCLLLSEFRHAAHSWGTR